MKILLIGLLSQALFCSLVLGHHLNGEHHNDDDHDDDGHQANQTKPTHHIAPYNANFAHQFYSHLATKYPTDNIFFSPVSICVAFLMLSLGAKSQTQSQILEGLGFDTSALTAEDIHKGSQQLLHVLNQPNDDVQLSMTNAVFVSNEIKLLEKFLDDAKNYYNSETVPTDFQKSEEAKNKINNYVEKKTNGKIKDLVDKMDPATVLVLINTIFFQGTWKYAFNKNNTRERDFHVDEKTVVKVPMMTQQAEYRVAFIQKPGCAVVEVPYKGNASAIIILPDAGKLHEVEEALRNGSLQTWSKQLRSMQMRLTMPKFSASNTLDLKSELSEMGIKDVFSGSADLSGITGAPLRVSKAVHESVVTVDEEGTEAAAATAVTLVKLSLRMQVLVDRPFMFIIKDKKINSPLFVGRIMNPDK